MNTKYLLTIVGLPLALLAVVRLAPATDAKSPVAEVALPGEAPKTLEYAECAGLTSSEAGSITDVSPPAPADDDEIKIETRPDGTVIIPAGRPEWVSNPKPQLIGNVYTIPVSSEPRALPHLAKQALDEALVKATNEFILQQLGSPLAPTLVGGYDARQIRQQFVRPGDLYDEEIIVSFGPMHQSHALLQFGPDFQGRLQAQWAEVRATSRLTQLGLLAGASLLLLGSVFGYFRLDNATRGYYTGRLQFMAAAAILAIIGAGALLARWITWL